MLWPRFKNSSFRIQNIHITTDFALLAPCDLNACTSEIAILAASVIKLYYSTFFLALTTEGMQICRSSIHVQTNMFIKRWNICYLNVMTMFQFLSKQDDCREIECDFAEGYEWDTKISGIVTKNYLKYSYKFETLVPFKVLPLWPNARIPATLSLLGTFSKIFNKNFVKGPSDSRWISATLTIHLRFETHFTRGYKTKSRKERCRVSRGGGTSPPFCF